MNDSDYNRLREESRRRPLTPAEEADLRAWLATHPELRADWDADLALTKMLDRLPDAPVPSNFTARVLRQVECESATVSRGQRSSWNWLRSLLPKAAIAAVVLSAGLLAVHEHRFTRREQLAQSVATVSEIASLPSPEILQDFDTIRQMNQQPAGDQELLAALTQ